VKFERLRERGSRVSKILVDSNILIELLNGDERALTYLSGMESCACSVLTVYEIYAGLTFSREEQRKTAKILFGYLDVIPVDFLTAQKAAEYTTRYGKGKAPDHLIAATAHLGGYDLATHNAKDFPMLETLEPYEVIP